MDNAGTSLLYQLFRPTPIGVSDRSFAAAILKNPKRMGSIVMSGEGGKVNTN